MVYSQTHPGQIKCLPKDAQCLVARSIARSFSNATHPQLIDSLLGSADAEAFRDPVDWRGLGLHDYPHIIKRPMDLGTVKLRLERGAYATAEACAADVRLIWENCRTYNTGGVPRNLHKVRRSINWYFGASVICSRVRRCMYYCTAVKPLGGGRWQLLYKHVAGKTRVFFPSSSSRPVQQAY